MKTKDWTNGIIGTSNPVEDYKSKLSAKQQEMNEKSSLLDFIPDFAKSNVIVRGKLESFFQDNLGMSLEEFSSSNQENFNSFKQKTIEYIETELKLVEEEGSKYHNFRVSADTIPVYGKDGARNPYVDFQAWQEADNRASWQAFENIVKPTTFNIESGNEEDENYFLVREDGLWVVVGKNTSNIRTMQTILSPESYSDKIIFEEEMYKPDVFDDKYIGTKSVSYCAIVDNTGKTTIQVETSQNLIDEIEEELVTDNDTPDM